LCEITFFGRCSFLLVADTSGCTGGIGLWRKKFTMTFPVGVDNCLRVLYIVNVARKRHPIKVIEEAVQYAESQGWTVIPSGKSAHAWGILRCSGDCSQVSVWSTPVYRSTMQRNSGVEWTAAHTAEPSPGANPQSPTQPRSADKKRMTTYEFTLMVSGVEEDNLDALYEATDGAATADFGSPWFNKVDFAWKGNTFGEAILDAITHVEEVAGLRVVRIEPDQFVWAAEIAERVGRSRQSVDQLIKGQRGGGDFPPPVAGSARNPLWRWSEVQAWFAKHEHRALDDDRAFVVGAINGTLEARRYLRERPDPILSNKLVGLLVS